MSLVIWKTMLKHTEIQDILVPGGAEFLTAREQFNDICIWYRCDPDIPPTPIRVTIVGTGHPAPQDDRYIGSASLNGGEFIFHVFAPSVNP